MIRRPTVPVVPLALTAGLLLARVLAVPALGNPLGTPIGPSIRLEAPPLYMALAPLFTTWDAVSMLPMSRLRGFLLGCLLLYAVWRAVRGRLRGTSWRRESATAMLALSVLVAFIIGGLLWHRPMLALRGVPSGNAVVDFHSHTSVSHDVRGTLMRGFDAAANRRWHRRAGFDAVFLTDHNTVVGQPRTPPVAPPWLCPGIEISAWRAHIVLLGDRAAVDHSRYNGSLDELLALLQTSDAAYGALSVASLPEYERNHRDRLEALAAAGLDGLEIVNASPKANEITAARRDSIIALARRNRLFVVGVSDSHGWGATSMVWNLVPVPASPARVDPCRAILARIRSGGVEAVTIVERHRLRAESGWPGWLTPVGALWESWRSMSPALALSWLVWVWGAWAARRAIIRTSLTRPPR